MKRVEHFIPCKKAGMHAFHPIPIFIDSVEHFFVWFSGIGSFTIVDGQKVASEDVGNK